MCVREALRGRRGFPGHDDRQAGTPRVRFHGARDIAYSRLLTYTRLSAYEYTCTATPSLRSRFVECDTNHIHSATGLQTQRKSQRSSLLLHIGGGYHHQPSNGYAAATSGQHNRFSPDPVQSTRASGDVPRESGCLQGWKPGVRQTLGILAAFARRVVDGCYSRLCKSMCCITRRSYYHLVHPADVEKLRPESWRKSHCAQAIDCPHAYPFGNRDDPCSAAYKSS